MGMPCLTQRIVHELEIQPAENRMAPISFNFCHIANKKAAIIDIASEINNK